MEMIKKTTYFHKILEEILTKLNYNGYHKKSENERDHKERR